MKLILTGIGGLLGPAVAGLARQQGYQVIGVARRRNPQTADLAGETVIADLAGESAARVDWRRHAGATVVHLAGETRIHGAPDFQRDNCTATAMACRIARQTGGRLVFLSSSAVYSGPETGYPVRRLHESNETEPGSAYGRSKKAAEELIRERMTDAVILRLFSVLSPRLAVVPDRGHLVQAILRALATNEPVVIRVDRLGRPAVRDYLRDAEVARGILEAAGAPRGKSVAVLNLCTGIATDARQMVAFAAEAAGREIPIRLERETGSVNPVMVGDTGLRRAVFGHVPASRVREFWQELLAPVAAGQSCAAARLLPKG